MAEAKADVRLGIIGSGVMGIEHMLNVRLLAGVRVVAVADNNEQSRREAAQAEPAAVVVETTAELLAMDEVDALVICTPNYTHIDVLRECIPSGKHILVEKPMCTTMADCLEVEALVAQHMAPGSGRLFWVGMEYRYMPPIARLLRCVDDGGVGQLRMVHIREHRFPFLLKVGDWNRFNAKTGGTLVEKCCHFWDLMRRINRGAQALSVFASGNIDVNHLDETYELDGQQRTPDIVDNAFAVVDFDNGVRGCLDLCMFAEDRQHEEVTAVGSTGKAHAEAPACVFTHHTTVRTPSRRPPVPGQYEANTTTESTHVPQELLEAGYHEGAVFYELEAFVQALRHSTPAIVTIEDGTAAVAMGLAAELSIRERRVVQISEIMAGIEVHARPGKADVPVPTPPAPPLENGQAVEAS